MNKIINAVLFIFFAFTSMAWATTSTVNPLIPVNGQPINAPPIQQNFLHTYNDINNLYNLFSESTNPGGAFGSIQYNNNGVFGGYAQVPVSSGGTNASTAQGAQNNLNAYPATFGGSGGPGTGAYVIPQCAGAGDEGPLTAAALAAYNTRTAINVPNGNSVAGKQPTCMTNNTFTASANGVTVVDFFAWPKKQAYQAFDFFNSGGPKGDSANIVLGSGGSTSGFVIPYCYFNLGTALHMGFFNLNIVGTVPSNPSDGEVAVCAGTNSAIGIDHAIWVQNTYIGNIDVGIGAAILPGTPATGSYTFTANPTNGQNIVLNGVTWTFVTSGAVEFQTNIQGSATATVTQLAADLSSINPWPPQTSAEFAIQSPAASYTANGLVLNISILGTNGNHYTLAAGTYGGTPSGATLTGGVDAGNCRFATGGGAVNQANCGNNYLPRVVDSTIINVSVGLNGNLSDAFILNNELTGGIYSMTSFTTDFSNTFGPSAWKVIGNRTEFSGAVYDLTNINTALFIGNSFDRDFSPCFMITGNASNITIIGNTMSGCALGNTQPYWLRGKFLYQDAAIIMAENSGFGKINISGNVITPNGRNFSGHAYNGPAYWVTFEGADDNISVAENVGAWLTAAYHVVTSYPAHFVSDNVQTPYISMGRTIGLGTSQAQAGLDASGQLTAYMPPLIAPLGTQTPLIVQAATITGATDPTSNLTQYYKFDEDTGTTVADSVSGNDGTWNGSLGNQWTTGKINFGGNFNGTNNYVTTTYGGITGTAAFSISLWFNTTTTTVAHFNDPLVYYGTPSGGHAISLQTNWKNGGGTTFSGLTVNNGTCAITYVTPNMANGTFHNVIMVVPASATCATVKIYYDNTLLSSTVTSVSPSSPINITAGDNLTFGGQIGSAGTNYTGVIDEASYYNVALTAGNVAFLYNGGRANQYPFTSETQTGNLQNFTDESGTTVYSAFGPSGGLSLGTSVPVGTAILEVNGVPHFAIGTTGANTVSLGTNSPAIGTTAPYSWMKMICPDGTAPCYMPVFK